MEVTLNQDAQDQMIELQPTINVRVLGLIKRLEKWPNVSGVKALRGRLSGQYRVRTGDYRVQFVVLQDRLVVVQVGHRDGFYEE